MTQRIDWDEAYRADAPPAWNIGEPQPEYTALLRVDGAVHGEVLDAGCGHAELAMAVAALGHPVVGIDLSLAAIETATRTAADRGLSNASFVAADISSLSGYDGRFGTVFDSGLLHALPDELRDGYLRSVQLAAAPGAIFYVLAFGKGAFEDHDGPAPTQFTAEQLRAEISGHWNVDEIRPAQLHADIPEIGRVQMPGHLVIARKPG